MRKNKFRIIFILIAVITVISVIPAHATGIPRESIPDNTPQAAVDVAESYIKDTLVKVQNGLGYADAKGETNRILFNAFFKNETGGYSYGLLTIIANNAMFEYSIKFLSRIIRDDLHIPFKFRNLRHTYATILAESGISPRYVQEMPGHSKLEFTLKYYTHITGHMADMARMAIDEKLILG